MRSVRVAIVIVVLAAVLFIAVNLLVLTFPIAVILGIYAYVNRHRDNFVKSWLNRSRAFVGEFVGPSSGVATRQPQVNVQTNIQINDGSGPYASAIPRKREAFSRGMVRAFYYLDRNQIADLSSQIGDNMRLTGVEIERSRGKEAGIKASISLIDPVASISSSNSTRERFEVDATPAALYANVEKYLLDHGYLTFGLEDFDYDEPQLAGFKSMSREMHQKFDFAIPSELQERYIREKLAEQAAGVINRVASASGYVVLQQEFSIVAASPEYVTLDYVHPVSKFADPPGRQVRIQLFCDVNSLTDSGRVNFREGSSVKITAVGKVVRWDKTETILVVSPIAVY